MFWCLLLVLLACRPAQPADAAARGGGARQADDIIAGETRFPNGDVGINGYLARPRRAAARPAVVLTHGNPGVPEDMRQLADDLARAGFVALAIDANSRTPDHSQLELHVIRSYTFHRQWMSDIAAGVAYLRGQPFVRGERVGMVGFCGGGVVNLLYASGRPEDVAAVVALYAAPRFPPERNSPTDPKPSLLGFVDTVRIPVQYHYGTEDHMIPMADVDSLRQRLAGIGAPAEVHTYEGADHAFFGVESPNHSPEASAAAQARLLQFLRRHLDQGEGSASLR